MAQEFTLKSEAIENKINQLLPTQGGFQPGVDFSASTMVVPIIDLTETAEGSSLRQDLQTSLSLGSCTTFSISNTSTTIINTTGYFRIFGNFSCDVNTTGNVSAVFNVTDGTTTKALLRFRLQNVSSQNYTIKPFDFLVLLQAGESIIGVSPSTKLQLDGVTRQIADLSGNLTNP